MGTPGMSFWLDKKLVFTMVCLTPLVDVVSLFWTVIFFKQSLANGRWRSLNSNMPLARLVSICQPGSGCEVWAPMHRSTDHLEVCRCHRLKRLYLSTLKPRDQMSAGKSFERYNLLEYTSGARYAEFPKERKPQSLHFIGVRDMIQMFEGSMPRWTILCSWTYAVASNIC